MIRSSLALFLMLALPIFSQGRSLAAPVTGAYQGAFADFGASEDEVTETKIKAFQVMSGKKLVWAYFSNIWRDGEITFPANAVGACVSAGVIPYIRLMPWSDEIQNHADPLFTMQKFLSGEFDVKLKTWARAAVHSKTPLMLEFGPEVNGNWFPWNGQWNGGARRDAYGDPRWPDGPERFRDVYRRIITLFRAEGLSDVTWVLHVDSNPDPDSEWNQAKYYYPGDDYIDWIGVSVFGAQLPSHDWVFFESRLRSFGRQLEGFGTSKPVMISEFGVIEGAWGPEAKASWIHRAFTSIQTGIFPRVKGMSYWNSTGWGHSDSGSFKIDSSELPLKAYQTEVHRDFWLDQPVFSP